MPFSSPVVDPPPKELNFSTMAEPDVGDDDECEIVHEEAEEEMEVEEEIEVGEGIEEEELDKEDEVGEALTSVNQMDYQNDTSQAIEPHCPEESIRSGSNTTGRPVATAGTTIEAYSGICDVACLNTKGQGEESQVDGEVTKKQDGGASLHGKWERLSPRSSSLNIQFSDGSKRQAIVCDFFSKGWCIKGSTCKFIHTSDHGALSSQCHKKNLDAAEKNTRLLDAEASSIPHIPLDRDGKIPGEKIEMELPLQKDDPLVTPSFTFGEKSVRRELSKEEYCHYSFPVAKDSSSHWMCSSSSVTASENYRNKRIPPPLTGSEIVPRKIYQPVAFDHNSSLPNSSIYKPPLSLSYSSWNPDPVDPQKLLDGKRDYSGSELASSGRSFSSFSGSDRGNLSRSNILSDTQHSVGSKRKISFDWEPSAPFRPSFYITQRLLSPGSLYDPIRDSFEQTSSGDGPPKSFYSGIGTSVLGSPLQLNENMVPKWMLGSECRFGKYSDSGQNLYANDSIKSLPAKDSCETDTDLLMSMGDQWGNSSTFLKEEKKLNSDHVRDVKEADKKCRDRDSELQSGESRQKTGVKEERVGKHTDADLDISVDTCIQKDSRTLKYFHAALVEFVKELLKSTWHEGIISKDVHKMIVKKAVDKVLGSLQPYQIPSTSESVKNYLSFSKRKIAKLIEGYVDKYCKS